MTDAATGDAGTLGAYRGLIADVYELAGLSRRLSEAEASVQGSSVARWHVLSVVSEQPLTVPAIAQRLGHRRQPVQRTVDELLAAGRLDRRSNPGHARSPLIAITRAGEGELAALWSASAPHRAALIGHAGLAQADLEAAQDVLERLLVALRGG